jgi:hypothetical protein
MTRDENAALLRLWKELEEAALYAAKVAKDSPEFREADQKSGIISRRIREISGNNLSQI